MRILIFLLSITLLTRCKDTIDYYKIDTFSPSNKLRAVIEIPAGTNNKIEYNSSSFKFEIDKENGKDRVIKYLPYPGNYGFIPGTLSNTNDGGDGDALDIIVISSAIPSGTLLEVNPIAILKLIDNGEKDYKVIAIPSDTKLRTIDVSSLDEINSKYSHALSTIENWFLNYNPKDPAQSLGWGDATETLKIIERSMIKD